MTKIVDFQAKKAAKEDPISGEATCMGCRHTWPCTAPAPTNGPLICPECKLDKGVFSFLFHVAPGTFYMSCFRCGTDAYRVLSHGVMCVGCGEVTLYQDLNPPT